jgi:DNA-binding transcriptional LysR family regulator
LAVHGSIAAAAEVLWLTPSAVSQQLAALQRETSVQLIEKSGRGVTLTPAGRTLVEHAEEIFRALRKAEAALDAFQLEPMGCIRVGVLASLVGTTLPVMDGLSAEYEELTFEVEDLETEQSLAALECGRVDISMVDLTDWRVLKRRCIGIEAIDLFEDPLVAVYQAHHPFAERETLEWSDLADERWIVGQRTWSFLTLVFDTAGFRPSVVARVRELSAALGLIRQGWGISVLPRMAVAEQSDGIAWRAVTPTLSRSIVAVTRSNGTNGPAVRSLIERLRQSVQARQSSLALAS